jgi:hypothetical protein
MRSARRHAPPSLPPTGPHAMRTSPPRPPPSLVAYQAALISEADIEEEYNDVMAREELDEAAYIDI